MKKAARRKVKQLGLNSQPTPRSINGAAEQSMGATLGAAPTHALAELRQDVMGPSQDQMVELVNLLASFRNDLEAQPRYRVAFQAFLGLCEQACDGNTLLLFVVEASESIELNEVAGPGVSTFRVRPCAGTKTSKMRESIWRSLRFNEADQIARDFPRKACELADEIEALEAGPPYSVSGRVRSCSDPSLILAAEEARGLAEGIRRYAALVKHAFDASSARRQSGLDRSKDARRALLHYVREKTKRANFHLVRDILHVVTPGDERKRSAEESRLELEMESIKKLSQRSASGLEGDSLFIYNCITELGRVLASFPTSCSSVIPQ